MTLVVRRCSCDSPLSQPLTPLWHCGCVGNPASRRRWVLWALVTYAGAAALLLLSPVGPGEIVTAIAGRLRGALGWNEFRGGWIEVPANVLLFVPLGFLLTLLFRRPWVGAAIAVMLSVAAEGTQILLPGRQPSLRDIVANALGALIGAGVAWLIVRHHRDHHAPPTETSSGE